jgi:tRNA threonylcarbamoyladenosine biosynthesis protein TsaE
LGAGKTVFVRGLARGLGVTDRVTSPTYALNNVYRGKVMVAHYDAYRLEGFDDLLDAGWDEYDSGIRVVEWAQRVGEAGGICVMISSQAREPQLNCASSRSSETERELSLCFLP